MIAQWFIMAPIALPAIVAICMGALLWTRRSLEEQIFARMCEAAFTVTLLCVLALLLLMLLQPEPFMSVPLGSWFSVGDYHFRLSLIADRLSMPFVLYCIVLAGLIGAFSQRYLHREKGFFQFYFLLALFGTGFSMVVLAGSLSLLFIGWEIVGLTSALLIAFFAERRKPVEHGLWAFTVYRFCDIGLLAATVWTEHCLGTTELSLEELAPWATFPLPSSHFDATLIGFLLLWAAMGKSAQIPLSGWLPRAMEGPTPSSAIFYGAISIHLGPYLLLRAAPMIEQSFVLQCAVFSVGLATALHATFVGRVQTDIKSALAYASMTQVAVIFMEIALGLHYLAILHILGHASLRSLEILQSPSLLQDHHQLEQAIGRVLPKTGGHWERLVPKSLQPWLYRHALERGYFDDFLRYKVIETFKSLLGYIDALDQHWTQFIMGSQSISEETDSSLGREA